MKATGRTVRANGPASAAGLIRSTKIVRQVVDLSARFPFQVRAPTNNWLAPKIKSDLSFLCQGQSIFDIDAEISDGVLNL